MKSHKVRNDKPLYEGDLTGGYHSKDHVNSLHDKMMRFSSVAGDDHSAMVVKCTLDENQCLSLHDILYSFQTAINEEQAWAICYQTVKCFHQHYQPSQCYIITDPAHVLIHKEGYVHPKTLYPIVTKGSTNSGLFAPLVSSQITIEVAVCVPNGHHHLINDAKHVCVFVCLSV